MQGSDELKQSLSRFLPEDLAARLAPSCRARTLNPGQTAIAHGDGSSDVYLVIEGALQAEMHSMSGKEVIYGEVGPGDLVGEYAALDHGSRSADMTATTHCTLVHFAGREFREAVFSSPESAAWIAERLLLRLRQQMEKIFELNVLAVRSRLHCDLLRLCLNSGINENVSLIEPAPTHQQLASRIGSHREAVTKELGYLAGEGILEQEGRSIRVGDVAKLFDHVKKVAGESALVERVGLHLSTSGSLAAD